MWQNLKRQVFDYSSRDKTRANGLRQKKKEKEKKPQVWVSVEILGVLAKLGLFWIVLQRPVKQCELVQIWEVLFFFVVACCCLQTSPRHTTSTICAGPTTLLLHLGHAPHLVFASTGPSGHEHYSSAEHPVPYFSRHGIR